MKFLASRINMLKDPITLRRYAQSLTLTDMPNIWADGSAVRNFEQSFFDDLAFRTTTRRQSRVVKSVLKWLGVDDVISAEAAQEQMIARFHEKPWNEDCWI